ncbi:MAG TPA: DinB family protein [Ferruginibacter sp.]|nr:DinB family protein [Ferruginibacter sp.]
MDMIKMFLKELEQEAVITRKMLERVPDDKYDWKPHEKSMSIRQLATHIAELPGWVPMIINTTELDFAVNKYEPVVINNTKDLVAYFEKILAESKAALQKAREEDMSAIWTLRNGTEVYSADPKSEVVRMTYSQIIHHRAQLGVFFRLLNIPVPGSYGPSADDMSF